MNKYIYAFLLAVILIAAQPANAETNNERCDGILRDGVMTEETWQTSTHAQLILIARMSQMTANQAKDSYGHKGYVGVPGIAEINGTFDVDKFNKMTTDLRRSIDINQLLNSSSSYLLSSGDSVIVNAWTKCIQAGGLTIKMNAVGDTNATVEITWNAYPVATGKDL